LKIVKALNSENRYKYAVSAFDGNNKEYKTDAKFYNILKETVVKISVAKNLIVVKTYSGMAQAAGAAIDAIRFSEIVGTIGGDDSILLVFATDETANQIADKLSKIVW
jgi:transcriptional regulator of arginine metabolism